MVLTPDEFQSQLYRNEIEPNLKKGAVLAFAHGFAIHYNQIVPRADLDVVMIAPKAPGHTVRNEFTARRHPRSWSRSHRMRPAAQRTSRCRMPRRSAVVAPASSRPLQDETETDLFGEQAVLCGGAVELVKAGFETLVEPAMRRRWPTSSVCTNSS